MAGKQIRWQSVGRIAAVAVALIAAVAALPSLLGSDSPPPVPDDVGLVPPPIDATAELPPEPLSPAPPPIPASQLPENESPARGHETGSEPPPRRRKRSNRGVAPPGDERAGEARSVSVYMPVPAYSPPASRREFGIEP
jgi:hypothetical protein